MKSNSFDIKKQNLMSYFKDFNNLEIRPGHQSIYEGSRNKAKFSISTNYQFGSYDADLNFTTNESDISHTPLINELIPVLREYFIKYQITPYNLQTKKGELKRVIISSFEEGGIIRIVLRSMEALTRIEKLFNKENHPLFDHFKIRSLNIQPEHSATLTGEKEILISKEKYLKIKIGKINLYPSAESFFQTNTFIASKLYESVAKISSRVSPKKVLDLYCGTGGFALHIAPYAKEVLGLEITSEAISGANISLQELGYKNLEFQVKDLNNESLSDADFILVNPPRRGLGEKVVKELLKVAPENLVYSSCNPETLLSDAHLLKDQYELLSLEAFDMFPLTDHLEVLAHFSKKHL